MKYILILIQLISVLSMYSQEIECLETLNDFARGTCKEILEGKCDREDLGTVMLLNESLSYAKIFCDSLYRPITFVNSSGQKMQLVIEGIHHEMANVSYDMGNVCYEDLTKSSQYCLHREEIRIYFKLSDYKGASFGVKIFPSPEFYHPKPNKIGDYFTINYFFNNHSQLVFTAVIGQGSQEFDSIAGQRIRRSIKFNERRFGNVITQKHPNGSNKSFQFYLSKEQGIIAFLDTDGDLWSLKD